MWPNELALFIIELFNLTSDEAKGVTVLSVFGFYIFVVCFILTFVCKELDKGDPL